MAKTHYDVLGLPKTCTAEQIRSSYRKLVLKYHPDRAKTKDATDIFIRVTEAYEVLSDPARRREYDRYLATLAQGAARPAPANRTTTHPPAGSRPRTEQTSRPSRNPTLTADLSRLGMLFGRGQIGEAERLAQILRQKDPRQPIPYAVLGDIARARGELREAVKMYAYAIQMDPSNDLYRIRHDEMVRILTTKERRDPVRYRNLQVMSPLVAIAMVLLACIYLANAQEEALLPTLSMVSTWTLGLVGMAFLSGVVLGASLCIGQHLDRFHTSVMTSVGRVSPNLALATVAIANFWVASVLYLLLGLSQGGFNKSTSRLVGAVAGVTGMLALAAAVNGKMDAGQVMLWAGNLVYVGSLCGWMVADSLGRG